MAYFIHVMESVVNKDYILVYFHAQAVSENLPDSNFFKQLYAVVDNRYKTNLRALYVVHASWWLKVSVGKSSSSGIVRSCQFLSTCV